MGARTVLITGSSTGIGRECVDAFADAGWNVCATMRRPEEHADLAERDGVLVTRLDVTESESISNALEATVARFGRLDCVVNNAGYGLVGPFEGATPEQIHAQFETNVFGVMNVCREVLPLFRAQRSGTIMNMSSMGGRMTFPLYSMYTSTKWALEGFSEGLHYELRPFNIRVRIIEPGPINTDFYARSQQFTMRSELTEYQAYVDRAFTYMQGSGHGGAPPRKVARRIVRAAGSRRRKLRWATDWYGRTLLILRRLVPEWFFIMVLRRVVTGR